LQMVQKLSELVVEIHLIGQVDAYEIDKQNVEDRWRVLQKVVAVDAWFCSSRRNRFDRGPECSSKEARSWGLPLSRI
jgi:hypothetical protein